MNCWKLRMARSLRPQTMVSLVVALVLCLGLTVQAATTDDPTSAATTALASTPDEVTTPEITTPDIQTTTEEEFMVRLTALRCQTDVRGRDPNHKPIEGQNMELQCFGNHQCGENASPNWYKNNNNNTIENDGDNDTVVDNSNRRILLLKNLKSAQNGKYWCELDTPESRGEPYILTVGTLPVVHMEGPGPVVKGGNGTIKCIASGTPTLKFTWMLEDHVLSFHGQDYTISGVNHTHQGMYRCDATNTIGTGYGIYYLDVLYPPVGSPTITPKVSAIIAETEQILKCDISHLDNRGNPEATRYKWVKSSNTGDKKIEAETISLLSGSVSETFNLTCALQNYYGDSSDAEHMALIVEAPVTIEQEPKSEPNDTIFFYKPDIDGSFNLTYVISGSHFTKLRLFRDSSSEELLTNKDFTYKEREINGTYNYGQEKATEIMLDWNFSKDRGMNDVCSNLTYFDDVYTLQARGTAAGKPSEANTTFRIETQFIPRWNGVDDPHIIKGKIGEKVTIECDVCSNPPPTKYEWSHKYTKLPDHTGRELIIEKLQTDDLGEYGCRPDHTAEEFVIKVEQIKTTPIALIAGGTVAIVAVLVIIIVIIVCVVKRKKSHNEASHPDVETRSLDELSNNRSSRPKPKVKPKPILPGADECRPHHDYPSDTAPPVPSGPRPNQSFDDDGGGHVYEQDVDDPQEIYDDIGDAEDDYITPMEGNEYVERGRAHSSYHQRGRYQH